MSPALTNRGHSDRPSVITNQRRLSHHRGGTGTAMGIEKGVWPEAELTARPDPAAGAPAPSGAPRAAAGGGGGGAAGGGGGRRRQGGCGLPPREEEEEKDNPHGDRPDDGDEPAPLLEEREPPP